MALKSKQAKNTLLPYAVYAGLGLAVLLPLLLPGHIMTLDMAFAPNIPAPDHVTSSYLFRLLLHGLNVVLPTQIIEKLLLFLILFLSGIGLDKLARYLYGKTTEYESLGTYIAGAFYMINPFTYSRFMAGQYSVLLGYALIPFFVLALLRFLDAPTRRSTLILTFWALVISIVSIHSVGLIIIVSFFAGVLGIWRFRKQPHRLIPIMKYGFASLVALIVASSYWLVPLIQGRGETAQTIANFNAGDSRTFATEGDGIAGQLSNVMQLQGFWAEGQALYVLPQASMPAWALIALMVWVLVVIGGITLWRKDRRFGTTLLGLSALGAAILSVGNTSSWLAEHVSLFAGFREPHKFVGLIALLYAIFAGQGTARLILKYQKRVKEATYVIPTIVGLMLVTFTPNMFWGFGGQLQPRHYPAGWFAVNETLNRDKDNFQVLFLPWHLYMRFNFADRIIANPAEDFFNKPTIVSNDPEFGSASLTNSDRTKRQLDQHILPAADTNENLGAQLARLNIKYVILAKEADSADYDYLNHQKKLKLIQESATIKLYRNTAFGK